MPVLDLRAILFDPNVDRAGNSTGILMASAIVSLMFLRTGRPFATLFILLSLGVAAGAGA